MIAPRSINCVRSSGFEFSPEIIHIDFWLMLCNSRSDKIPSLLKIVGQITSYPYVFSAVCVAGPIAMMIALFFMISFVTGLQNPMALIVKSQFEASSFMSQLGNAANFIAYAFMGIPAGLLLEKIGYKK